MHRKLTCSALFTGVLLILIGCSQGQAAFVMAKAIRICLECVGIG